MRCTYFSLGEYNWKLAQHISAEEFEFKARPEVAFNTIESFRDRQDNRLSNVISGTASADKIANPLVVFSSQKGSGKTTNLAHLVESVEYAQYVKDRQHTGRKELQVSQQHPLVCLLAFNSAMGYKKKEGNTLGLRIVFGALRSAGHNFTMSWSEFYEMFQNLQEFSGIKAVQLIRHFFGEKRLMLIGVDELAKIKNANPHGGAAIISEIAHTLGSILDQDGCTDVVMTALTPAFAEKLVTGSNRPIRYVPITLLNNRELSEEFKPYAQKLVEQVKNELRKYGKSELNSFIERILRSFYLLASGHPRTIEFLINALRKNSVFAEVQPLLGNRKFSAYQLLKELSGLPQFMEFSETPSSDVQREIVLSMVARDSTKDTIFRMMLEENECFLHKQVGDSSSTRFIPTTSLATFFRIITSIYNDIQRKAQVGPLSLAVHKLQLQ